MIVRKGKLSPICIYKYLYIYIWLYIYIILFILFILFQVNELCYTICPHGWCFHCRLMFPCEESVYVASGSLTDGKSWKITEVSFPTLRDAGMIIGLEAAIRSNFAITDFFRRYGQPTWKRKCRILSVWQILAAWQVFWRAEFERNTVVSLKLGCHEVASLQRDWLSIMRFSGSQGSDKPLYVRVYIHEHMHIYIYIHVYVHIYIHIYIYIYVTVYLVLIYQTHRGFHCHVASQIWYISLLTVDLFKKDICI